MAPYTMNSENELSNSVELAKKLIKKREEVKRKMDLLKQGEIRQEGAFSPITKRLKTISDQLPNTDVESYNNNTNKNDNHNKKKTETDETRNFTYQFSFG
jgi:seryl-tRNA synthetase